MQTTDNFSATSTEKIDFHGIKLSVQSLFSGSLLVGTTGSGKTRSGIRPLLRALLVLHAADPRLRAGACIIDPKGDLADYVREALARCGRSDLVSVGPGKNDATYNPIGNPSLSASQVAHLLLSAAVQFGPEPERRARSGERFWELADRSLLTAMVSTCRRALEVSSEGHQALRIQHLNQLRPMLSKPDKELRQWASQLAAELEGPAGNAWLEFAALPEGTTRPCIAASVGAVLQTWAEPPLSLVVNPSADRPEADLSKIISDGTVVLVNTAHAENAVELLPVQVLLKLDFYRRVLARPRTPTNQERPVWLFIDEFTRVFSAQEGDSEANFLESARSSRCGAILATQSLSGLICRGGQALVDKLTALTNSQIFLTNTDPATIAWAERCLGTRTVHRFHQTVEPSLPPPLLVPGDRIRPARKAKQLGVRVPCKEPRVDLTRLKTGELWIRTPSIVKRILTDPAAP
jgi:type IV secretory pathway TraG/TraD family ATPase VirD4